MRHRLQNGVADRIAGEHEIVARVVDGREDAAFQRAQRGFFATPFQPADTLVDQGEKIGHAIGHRRIRRDRALIGRAAHGGTLGAAKCFFRFRNEVAKDIHFFRHRLAAAENHFRKFLKAHQPEGKIQRIGVDDDRMIGKGGREFIVRIENEDTQLRVRLDRLVQKQRDGGGLAHARRADDGEMFGEHLGNADGGVDRIVLRQPADGAGVALTAVVNLGKIAGADAMRHRTEIGVTGNAGGKALAAVLGAIDFANQFNLDQQPVRPVRRPVVLAGSHGKNQRRHTARTHFDGDQASDGPELRDIGGAGFRFGGDGGMRTVTGDDAAKHAVRRLLAGSPFVFVHAGRIMKRVVTHIFSRYMRMIAVVRAVSAFSILKDYA
jgi:hypothetical protein